MAILERDIIVFVAGLADTEFVLSASYVHSILTDIKGELSGVGLLEADLDSLNSMIEQHKSAMQSQ